MTDLQKQAILFASALLVRLPFLFADYGVEEDSWGHVLNAALMNETGIYEVSRLPGHPLYEALLFIMWNVHSPFLYNLPSALAGAGSVVVFYRIARMHNIKNAFWWSLVFGFVPTLFISAIYTIDYCIALFFGLLSYEAALKNKTEAAGVWLAVAAGFRITALGMLLPIGYYLLSDNTVDKSVAIRLRKTIKVATISAALTFLFYLPPYFQYGIAFFDFHRPPYPIWPEIIYKMSIGVWGLIGLLALVLAIVSLLANRKNIIKDNLNTVWLLVAVVYTLAYFRMPEKAAFWIPILPFVLLFLARNLTSRAGWIIGSLLLISGWVFGINTTNSLTGSKPGKWAKTLTIAGEEIFIDPLNGAILNDFSKRQNKAAACERLEHEIMLLREPSVVIAGWWYAMIEVNKRDGKWSNRNVELVYFASPEELETWKNRGYQLRYLPEQERINDIKYKTDYTVTNATLLSVK